MESDERFTPSDALSAVSESRAAAADRLAPSWWYFPALGLWTGAFTVVFALGTGSVRWVGLFLFVAGCLGLTVLHTRRAGVTAVLPTEGPAHRWTRATAGTAAVVALAAIVVGTWTDLAWLVVVLAVVEAALVATLGIRSARALDTETRDPA